MIAVICTLVVAFLIVAGFGWLAGSAGVLFGLIAVATGILLFAEYNGLFTLPTAVKQLAYGAMGICFISTLGIWAATSAANKIAAFASGVEGNGTVAGRMLQRQYYVADDWVSVTLPPAQACTFSPEKSIVLHLENGAEFVKTPEGKLLGFQGNARGAEVGTMGENVHITRLDILAETKNRPPFKVTVVCSPNYQSSSQ